MSNNEVSELVQKFIKRKRNETRKTSKALVEHLKENNGIDDFDFVRMKKQARKYQRDDTIFGEGVRRIRVRQSRFSGRFEESRVVLTERTKED